MVKKPLCIELNKNLLVLIVILGFSSFIKAEVKSFMCGMKIIAGSTDKTTVVPDSKIQYLFLLQIQTSNKMVNWNGAKLQNYTENSSEIKADSVSEILSEKVPIHRVKREIIFNKFTGNLREEYFYELKNPLKDELVWVEVSFDTYLCKKSDSLL